MQSPLKGKRVLFFAPAFFNYEKLIANKIKELGAEVDLYDERSINSAWERAVLKVIPFVFCKKTETYYKSIIKENIDKDYDYILIIKGEMVTKKIISTLREVFPNARMCLYLYDSVNNVPGIAKKFFLFDSISSFDLKDCEQYATLKFRPLFFADQFRTKVKTEKKFKYDISFIGTIHSDRYSIIKKVDAFAKNSNLSTFWYLYLQSKFIFYFYKLTKKEFRNVQIDTFMFDKMSVDSISKIVDDTKVVLDVQHPKQTGLTMRTIEMIGMNKKIITTNDSIKRYDFYDPGNIAIISRKDVDIPEGFFENDFRPIPEEIYENYSLDRWVLEVLN